MEKTEVEVLEDNLEELIKTREDLLKNKPRSVCIGELVAISREIRETAGLLYGLAKL